MRSRRLDWSRTQGSGEGVGRWSGAPIGTDELAAPGRDRETADPGGSAPIPGPGPQE